MMLFCLFLASLKPLLLTQFCLPVLLFLKPSCKRWPLKKYHKVKANIDMVYFVILVFVFVFSRALIMLINAAYNTVVERH